MSGLTFQTQLPIAAIAPNRADIACFVGFVGRRNTEIPSEIERWLEEQGWTSPPYVRSQPLKNLLDLPVPIESWEMFDRLFAWDQRVFLRRGDRLLVGTTYLGAAVRSFFAQGGSKCYVIRVGDPWLTSEQQAERIQHIAQLIPGYPTRFAASAVDRTQWSGVGHLFGLPDVSFLCLPDLADAVRGDRDTIEVKPPDLPQPPEQFVECSEPEPEPPLDQAIRLLAAPRCNEVGYQAWARALQLLADHMAARRQVHQLREVQLVAAIPIPHPRLSAHQDLLGFLSHETQGFLSNHPSEHLRGLASAFVQLVYPWVRTAGSGSLPEQLESPDAILVGVLARNALTRGAFRSAVSLPLGDVQDVLPALGRDQMLRVHRDTRRELAASHSLLERVSLLGRTPKGLQVLSDVTTSLSPSYRPASINRLVAAIIRAARRLGEDIGFEPSSEQLWFRLRNNLENLLLGLWQAGALRGNSPTEAFQIRCDRTTMTQADIDNGRVIATVQFTAAAPIEQITVVLVMNEGGQVSRLPERSPQVA